LTREQDRGAKEVQDRMKYTVDFVNKGFKPNTRGGFIQDSFATLKELLLELPKSIKFDIEISMFRKNSRSRDKSRSDTFSHPEYPRLHEAVDAGVAPVAIELNTFIDTSLETIYRFAGDRTIILSSFTPEVCILLSVKQQTYPVVFITNAGKPPMMDLEMRASSLQVAVRFAKLWNLSGAVFASETLIMCPRLIKYVKRAGLSCSSYGLLNNIPDNAKVSFGLIANFLSLSLFLSLGLGEAVCKSRII
jgi:glycerophosphodiester phosphodiesterase